MIGPQYLSARSLHLSAGLGFVRGFSYKFRKGPKGPGLSGEILIGSLSEIGCLVMKVKPCSRARRE